jgi:hypothetical protein
MDKLSLDLYFINTQVFLLITQQRQIHVLIKQHITLNDKVTESLWQFQIRTVIIIVNLLNVKDNVIQSKTKEGV